MASKLPMFLINTKSDMDDSTTNIRRCTRRRRNSIRQAVPLLGIILLATTAFLVIAGNVEAKDPPRGGQTPLVLNPIQAFVATISDAKSHLVAAAVVRLIFCAVVLAPNIRKGGIVTLISVFCHGTYSSFCLYFDSLCNLLLWTSLHM